MIDAVTLAALSTFAALVVWLLHETHAASRRPDPFQAYFAELAARRNRPGGAG